MQIGDAAPRFSLSDLDGQLHQLQDFRGRIVVVNFWSCECPHSERTDSLLMEWIESWGGNVVLLPISSNVNESRDAIRTAALRRKLPLVLVDQQHFVADLYEALTTPHVFVVDAQGLLQYSGAVDDVNFGQRQPRRYFLQEAVQGLMDGAAQPVTTRQPYGCIIVRHALE